MKEKRIDKNKKLELKICQFQGDENKLGNGILNEGHQINVSKFL